MICRGIKVPSWPKLITQGLVCIGFAIAYIFAITPHWMTALVLLALAGALFYQARRAKISPDKVVY